MERELMPATLTSSYPRRYLIAVAFGCADFLAAAKLRGFLLFAPLFLDTFGLALAQDARHGADVFHLCAVCHSIKVNVNSVGPSLFGVVGRMSGSIDDYNYSAAMLSAGKQWTETELDRYIDNPAVVVPGNKMGFSGLKNSNDRKDLIAFLNTLR